MGWKGLSSIIRRVFILLLVAEVLWGMGFYFVLPTTTIPAFLNARGATPFMVSAMIILMGALPILPQLFGRTLLERTTHRQRALVLLHLAGMLPYLLIALLDTWAGASRYLLHAVVGLLALSQLLFGLIAPLWLDMVSQVIPMAMRGRYFGFATAAFGVGGIAGAVALQRMEAWLGDDVFRGAFLAGVACFAASMAVFSLTPIPRAVFDHAPEPPLAARIRASLHAVRLTPDFRRLVVSMCAQNVAIAIVPFLVIYAIAADGLRWPREIFAGITLWQALGGATAALFLGWAVDRFGPRWPWVGITLLTPIIVLLYPHAHLLPVLIFCSLLVGLLTTHWTVWAPALLELAPPGDKSGYVALANLAGLPTMVLGPLLIAVLIDRPGAGYHAAFLFAALAGIAALLPALAIRGRARRDAENLPTAANPPISP